MSLRRRIRGRGAAATDGGGDDVAGLFVNLFDCALVFALGFMLLTLQQSTRAGAAPDSAAPTTDETAPLERFRESDRDLSGRGTRLGIAYRLENGEVVYVPEGGAPGAAGGAASGR